MSINNSNRGFTLIELLIVIAIVGILVAVVIASLVSVRQNADISAFKKEARSLLQSAVVHCISGSNYDQVKVTADGFETINATTVNIDCKTLNYATNATLVAEFDSVSTEYDCSAKIYGNNSVIFGGTDC